MKKKSNGKWWGLFAKRTFVGGLAKAKLSIGSLEAQWRGNRSNDQDSLHSPFSVAAVESIDGRLFPHDITPPAFRSTIFYFLVGLHWWPVKTCKVSPTEMRLRTLFIPFPSLSFHPVSRSSRLRRVNGLPLSIYLSGSVKTFLLKRAVVFSQNFHN